MQGYTKLKNSNGMGRCLNDIGVILRIQGRYKESEVKLLQGLEVREKARYLQGITTTSFELGNLYMVMGLYERALEYMFKALALAESSKTKPKIFQIHEQLGEVYKRIGNFEKALEHKETFFAIKSEVTGEHASNKLKHLQTQFATEKSEKETEIHRLKNVELKKAYEEIEEKNKNILDSINYAKRIQEAILPSEEEFKTILPGSFVLYKPKDVVSGDFYWISKKGNKIFFAAVDCTGHGVPGALMSMIGNTLLNEIVDEKGITKPSFILDMLTESVIKSLKQTGAEGENKDGMDIAICVLENNKLEFAGANNPLWIVKGSAFGVQSSKSTLNPEPGTLNLLEIKGDKQPVGISISDAKPFTNHTVDLNPGDRVYIFTDGYADQFGGAKGKKFKYKQLQEKLLSTAARSMKEQKEILDKDFESWKGALEQVDDVLVIGFKA
jgi:serine phosphatase RsbU (regulator of sigma subunit)